MLGAALAYNWSVIFMMCSVLLLGGGVAWLIRKADPMRGQDVSDN